MKLRNKKWLRVIAVTLAVALMMQMTPVGALSSEETIREADAVNTASAEITVETEIEDLRTETAKHFRMSDGSFVAVDYGNSVHYKNENGKWADIDNTLSTVSNGVFDIVNGTVVKRFAKESDDGFLFSVSDGTESISFALSDGANTVISAKSGNEALTAVLKGLMAESSGLLGNLFATADKTIEQMQTSLEKLDKLNGPVSAQLMSLKDKAGTKLETLMEQVAPETLVEQVLYSGIRAKTDLLYEIKGNTVKESILLYAPAADYNYDFVLSIENLIPTLTDAGAVEIRTAEGEVRYTIPAPYMQDDAGEVSYDVSYELTELGDGRWNLRVSADADWLNSKERVYPVAIDPTLVKYSGTGSSAAVYSTTVSEGTPTTSSYASSYRYCGYANSTYKNQEVVLYLNQMPSIPSHCTVTAAQFALVQNSYTGAGTWSTITAHEVLADKSSSQTYWNWMNSFTWNTVHASSGFYSSDALDYVKLNNTKNYSTLGDFIYLDVTRAARKWYEGATNRAILLRSDASASKVVRSEFLSSYSTAGNLAFIVAYRNDVGVEDYYTYLTQDIGHAGTSYVSARTQHVTLNVPLFAFDSAANPFALSLVYNSALAGSAFVPGNGIHTQDYSLMKSGAGWKLSVQESIYTAASLGDDSGTGYRIWNDSDGTEHYFAGTTGTATDEDGLGLTLTQASHSGHTDHALTDKGGNVRYFCNGMLAFYRDAFANTIYMCYNGADFSYSSESWKPTATQNRLTSIWRVNKNGAMEKLLTLSYNSGNNLSAITDMYGRTAYLGYDSSAVPRLLSITHYDGETADYRYESDGRISLAYDRESDTGIEYTRDIDSRIYYVREFYADSVGSSVKYYNAGMHGFINSATTSFFRDYGNDTVAESTDDIVTHYVFDNWGRTVSSHSLNFDRSEAVGTSTTEYVSPTEVETAPAKQNKVSAGLALGTTAFNLLKDSGAEFTASGTLSSGTYWSAANSGSASSAVKSLSTDGESPRTGDRVLKIWVGNASSYGGVQTTATLEASKRYVFSAYVKASPNSGYSWGSGKIEMTVNGQPVMTVLDHATDASISGGWERISGTYFCSMDGTYSIGFRVSGTPATVYLDDLQVEKCTNIISAGILDVKNAAPSSANLLQNGDFEFGTGFWNLGTGASLSTASGTYFGSRAIQIVGSTAGLNNAYQQVNVYASAATPFLLSGWGKATSVAGTSSTFLDGNKFFGLGVRMDFTDGTREYMAVPFAPEELDWQFASGIVMASSANRSKTIKCLYIYCAYDYNLQTAWFDNVSLRREAVNTYSYDSNGNLATAKEKSETQTNYTYTNNDVTSATVGDRTYNYTYTNHALASATLDGVTTTYLRNSAKGTGVVTGQQIRASDGTGVYLETSATYDTNENLLSTETADNGNVTQYSYDTYGRLNGMSNTTGQYIAYAYDSHDRLASSSTPGVWLLANSYSNGTLSTITRTGYGNNYRTATTQQYAFGTDIWGRTTEISVGSGTATRSLAKYNYSGLNLRTAQLGYNSYDDYFAVIYYTRDDLGRMTEIGYLDADGAVYDDYFFYTAEGALSEMYRKVGTTITERYAFEYDALGRLVRTKKLVGDTTVLQTEHTYDVEDRIAGQIYRIGTTNFSQSYTYSASNGLLTRHTPVFGLARTYGYDGIRRLSSVSNGLYTKTYGYKTVSGSRSSSLVSSLAYSGLGLNYTYGYDILGNITSVVKNGSTEATYAYDLQNQLVSETVGGNTYAYNYDTVGNLMSVQKNGTTIKSYTYGDSAWADLLTAFTVNGVTGSITYDNVGNPLTYYNGTSYAMTWTPERRLATLTGGGKTVSYAYDMDGIRTSKTVNGTTTSYTTVSGQVVRETTGSTVIDFAYEDTGAPYAMRYNGSIYYYLLNLQGDVVGLVDAYGNTVASYSYDAWGNVLSATGSLAAINPLRYRGYYYDSETALYYVSSRYYDPMVGRWISADSMLISPSMTSVSTNMFAYCENNPIIYTDSTGTWIGFDDLIAGTVGALVGVASQLVNDLVFSAISGSLQFSSWQTYVGAGIGGAIGGISSLYVSPIAGAAIGSGSATLIGQTLENVFGGEKRTALEIAKNTTIDATIGAVTNKILPVNISGVTSGKNSMGAVFRAGLTKIGNKTAKRMSLKVFGKGFVSGLVGDANSVLSSNAKAMCEDVQARKHQQSIVLPSGPLYWAAP